MHELDGQTERFVLPDRIWAHFLQHPRPTSWFLVLGSWFLVLGSWSLELGSWSFLGIWFLEFGSSNAVVGFPRIWAMRAALPPCSKAWFLPKPARGSKKS